jgi:hypothetical protein
LGLVFGWCLAGVWLVFGWCLAGVRLVFGCSGALGHPRRPDGGAQGLSGAGCRDVRASSALSTYSNCTAGEVLTRQVPLPPAYYLHVLAGVGDHAADALRPAQRMRSQDAYAQRVFDCPRRRCQPPCVEVERGTPLVSSLWPSRTWTLRVFHPTVCVTGWRTHREQIDIGGST